MGSPVFWGRSSGGSGAINVPDDYFFADATSRDTYFTSNPTELIEGLFVVTNGTLQKYVSGSWVDYTAIIRGPAGATGATGQAGSNGTDGADGVGVPVGGNTGQILKKVDNSDFNTTWGDPVDADALVYKGAIDCSANPNYPAADAGDTYKASSAGHIGGASGPSVAVGDLIICSVDSTATGDHATVGSHWSVIGATTEGGVAGPTSSIDGNFPAFSGTSGGSIVDSGTGPSSFLQKTLATAANLFLVSSAANTWAVKTIAEIKTLLGLGGAAYLDVGTEAGSVCAGDDSRLSDSRTPTSHGNEAHSSTFLTGIDIHGATPETAIADNDEILIYDTSASANRRMTRSNFLDGISAVGAFTDLTDTPASYEGYDETYYVRVNAASNALEFATVPSSYTLPVATDSILGGIKIGSRLTITDGVLSADEQGGSYTLPTASADTLGGVKIGSGITITDGIISASGGGLTWNEVTGTTQAAAADNGYIANNESLVTITLPSTIAVGKIIRVAGKASGKWKIAQNEGQIIYFGDQNTTSGTAGYLAAQTQYDSIELLCITANTTFNVISVVGNITVV